MRYIANDNGYLLQVSFGAMIECNGRGCTEYTGDVPAGYDSLVDWFTKEGDKLHTWRVVAGNLTKTEEAQEPIAYSPLCIVKLWENRKPGDSFVARTVRRDLTKYSAVSFHFKNQPDGNGYGSTGLVPVGSRITLQYVTSDGVSQYRNAHIEPDGIVFDTGRVYREANDAAIIPLVIYGWSSIFDAGHLSASAAVCGEFLCGEINCGTQ